MSDTRSTRRRFASVGARVRFYREQHDLTQQAFAERVHVSQPTVSQWEKGIRLPSRRSQFLISEVLQVARIDLFREAVEAENAA